MYRLIAIIMVFVLICSVLPLLINRTNATNSSEKQVEEKTDFGEDSYGILTNGFCPTAESTELSLILYLYANDISFDFYTVGMGNYHLYIFTEVEGGGVLGQPTEWSIWYNVEDGSLHKCCFRLVECTNERLLELLKSFFTITQPEICRRDESQDYENIVWRTSYAFKNTNDKMQTRMMNLVVHCDYFEYDGSPFSVYLHFDPFDPDYKAVFSPDCFEDFYSDYATWTPC